MKIADSQMSTEQAIAADVLAALEADKLELPILPDMALKIRNMLDNPNVSTDHFVRALSAELVISMHIIKTANSAALSNGHPVGNLHDAIFRLGYRMLHSLVMNITMTKLFKASSPLISEQLKKLWEHSREVAANSYVLAKQHRHLSPELAMLAGLVHDIGALPLCHYADRHHSHLDQATLEGLTNKFAATISTKLLQRWNFPDELVKAVSDHDNLQRPNDSGLADYADVLTMANLQIYGTSKFVAWENVRAAARLGYNATGCQNFLSDHTEQLAVAQGMLANPPAR